MKLSSKKIYFTLSITSLLFFSCKKQSDFTKALNCNTQIVENLETVEDVKSLFSIDLPKNWKINLYKDELQSSIFTADTAKQLTETVLLDVTYINKTINFNDAFLLQQEQEHLAKKLVKTKSEKIIFKEKPTLIMQFKGRKGKYNYQVNNIYIQLNTSNFILAKTEVYGNSEIDERFCKAFSLIENINLKN